MFCIPLTVLQILNHPCILGTYFTYSWCMILSVYCWIQFGNISLRIFSLDCSSVVLAPGLVPVPRCVGGCGSLCYWLLGLGVLGLVLTDGWVSLSADRLVWGLHNHFSGPTLLEHAPWEHAPFFATSALGLKACEILSDPITSGVSVSWSFLSNPTCLQTRCSWDLSSPSAGETWWGWGSPV